MDSSRSGQPWGKLVKEDSGKTILLFNRECTVGRKKGCSLSFPGNKLISGEHCKIVKDERSGQVFLEDTSTNGTVINMSKVVKKNTYMLQNGDVIYFVYRKSEPEQNVAYVYHSIQTEQPLSQDSYYVERSACSLDSLPVSKIPLSVEPVMLSKAPRDPTQVEPQPSTSASHFCIENPSDCGKTEALKTEKDTDSLGPESKRRKTYHDGEYLLHTTCEDKTDSTKRSPESLSSKPPGEGTAAEKMEESLTCVICRDLLHDCISLQPCMHAFCAACYSDWMERSSFCPTCRCPVERICKNHILNNLVEAYFIQHPEKCRSKEELKSMDSRNKITHDILQPKVEKSYSDEDASSDYLFDLSDVDSDTDSVYPTMFCRQCPDNRFATSSNYWSPGLPPASPATKTVNEGNSAKPGGDNPSTSSDQPSGLQEYCCPREGFHIVCRCCFQPMPDRTRQSENQQVLPQHCSLCGQPFCHMYWGCKGIGCLGCLAQFSELSLTEKCLDRALNNNIYEMEVLKNYLSSKGKSWRDLMQEALLALQQGSFALTDGRITGNTIVCYHCGFCAFKELIYKYRQSIPPSELPAAVTSRPDCYWGRHCRTQLKTHHAAKFNHICEQTRFKI